MLPPFNDLKARSEYFFAKWYLKCIFYPKLDSNHEVFYSEFETQTFENEYLKTGWS